MNTPAPDPFDRALAAYSAREQARVIPPPDGFADRTAAVLARPRFPWKAVGASVVAVAVAAVAVGYVAWPKPQPAPVPQPIVATPEPSSPPPNIGETLSEAGGALAKLSRTTAEKATPRAFLPGDLTKQPDPPPHPADVPPSADALASVPASAKSSLEPVTGSTRRAISVFLRDTGLKAD
jgi:hypothetical protein